jgi:hypothetical protein
MRHETPAQKKKVHRVMGEFKAGRLKSGRTGTKVRGRRQAVAIAMREAGISRRPAGRRK